MSGDYSSGKLLEFLRQATLAGRMPASVAKSRRAAADALFTELNEDEAGDLRQLDIDALQARFLDTQGGGLRSEVVALYIERLSGAIDEFFRFVDAPTDFASTAEREKVARRRADVPRRSAQERALESVRLSKPRQHPDVIPVPLKEGRVVYLHGVPADLTAQEADKISRVIAALAEDTGDQE